MHYGHRREWARCNNYLLQLLRALTLYPSLHAHVYRVAQKIWHHFFLYTLTLPIINRFSKLFHCRNQEKISNNTFAKDPTTPQVCRYTTLLNVSYMKQQLKTRQLVSLGLLG